MRETVSLFFWIKEFLKRKHKPMWYARHYIILVRTWGIKTAIFDTCGICEHQFSSEGSNYKHERICVNCGLHKYFPE
jgi:hypothetical protein